MKAILYIKVNGVEYPVVVTESDALEPFVLSLDPYIPDPNIKFEQFKFSQPGVEVCLNYKIVEDGKKD